MQNNGRYAVPGHAKSSVSISMESTWAVSMCLLPFSKMAHWVLCSLSTRGDGVPVFIALIWDDLLNRGCEIWRRKTGNIHPSIVWFEVFFRYLEPNRRDSLTSVSDRTDRHCDSKDRASLYVARPCCSGNVAPMQVICQRLRVKCQSRKINDAERSCTMSSASERLSCELFATREYCVVMFLVVCVCL